MISIERQDGRGTYNLTAFNYGNSPAHIFSCIGPIIEFHMLPDEDLSVPPEYAKASQDQIFLAPKAPFVIGTVDPYSTDNQNRRNAKASLDNCNREALRLVAYGCIEYSDGVSKDTHKTAFCYMLATGELHGPGGSMIICGPREYTLYS
jgi:hypothetical protein